jgi:hypothetical protein
MKTIIQSLVVVLTFFCLIVVGPTVQAVVPAPDGGYAGANTAEGQNALFGLTTGGYNTAVGWLSLKTDATGSFNTAIGAGTLAANIADQNTATGAGALVSNYTGIGNTANGAFALFHNSTGTHNTAIGAGALSNNSTGSTNTALGIGAGQGVQTADDVIAIGINGQNVSHSCFIGNIRGVTTAVANAIPVLIDSDGQLGTMSSSRRFKTDVKPIDKASESILGLKPVSFRYKIHKDTTPQFGLIAEEVAEVNPALVIYDSDGKPYTVRYDAVNAMLLNEFLKEHRKGKEQDGKIQEQQTTIEELKSGMKALAATVNEQASQLRKVSAQLQINNATARAIVSDQ